MRTQAFAASALLAAAFGRVVAQEETGEGVTGVSSPSSSESALFPPHSLVAISRVAASLPCLKDSNMD